MQLFSLRKKPCSLMITGVGGEVSARSSSLTSLYLISRLDTAVRLPFTAAVVPRVTGLFPRRALHCSDWEHLKGLDLADPDYMSPAQ